LGVSLISLAPEENLSRYQENVLHSWSLVKVGTTAAQKKLFFNLRRLKGQMNAIDDGELQPEHAAFLHIDTDRLQSSHGRVVAIS
jgi:hypothetical protein